MIEVERYPKIDNSIPKSVLWADRAFKKDFPRLHSRYQSFRNCKHLDELELSVITATAALPAERERHFIFLFKSFCNVKEVEIFPDKEEKVKPRKKNYPNSYMRTMKRQLQPSKRTGNGHVTGQ